MEVVTDKQTHLMRRRNVKNTLRLQLFTAIFIWIVQKLRNLAKKLYKGSQQIKIRYKLKKKNMIAHHLQLN